MPTPLYYTVRIIHGRYPNASSEEVMSTYSSKKLTLKPRSWKHKAILFRLTIKGVSQ